MFLNINILTKIQLNLHGENNIFTGEFTNAYKKDSNGNAVVEFIESISVKNPILKAISYLFFNIKTHI